ncbi:hypothetical protein ABH931_006164 [Streptacidiphilus sp. MAP12-33]|uniref:hypothetical protein n=1 Tax=Streptacidiphilus sp. MAP12-33 TaxID=3156266 RepID=UPI003515CA4C
MTATQFPAWAAGQKITAAGLLQMERFFAFKPGATTVTSSTTLADDPDLQIVLTGTGTFLLDGLILYSGAATGTGDLKMQMNYTGTISSSNWTPMGVNVTSATGSVNFFGPQFANPQSVGSDGSSITMAARLGGYLVTSTTGTCKLQWAQNTSSATSTTVRAGSWLTLQQVA